MSLSLRAHRHISLLQGAGDTGKAREKVFSGQHEHKQRCAAGIQRQPGRAQGRLGTLSFPSTLLEKLPSTLPHTPQISIRALGWIRIAINGRLSFEGLRATAVVPVPLSLSLLEAGQRLFSPVTLKNTEPCIQAHYIIKLLCSEVPYR